MQHEGAENDCSCAATRNAERQQRHQRAADGGGRRGLRRDDAFSDSGAHLLPAVAELRLQPVADERGDGRARPGNESDDVAEQLERRNMPLSAAISRKVGKLGACIGDLINRLGGETGLSRDRTSPTP